jgi:5S rRNA maturation endonuclease (ribonuclease M5)
MQDIKQRLLNYLEANNKKYIERENKVSHSCINPLHNDNNASAYTILSETPFNYCSSCGFSLNTEKLYSLLEVGYDEKQFFHQQIKNMLKQAEPKLEKQIAPVYLPIKDKDFDKPYRGISAETYKKVGAYSTFIETFYQKRIIIPIYNYRNELRSFEAISTSSKVQPKILRPKNVSTFDLFGFENLLGESDSVFICEGIYNSLSFMELGYNSIFNFGVASIKDKIKTLLLKGVKNVILVGDADSTGKQFNKECYQLLKHNFNTTFFQFPYNFENKGDANDLLKKDREILQECIDKSLSKGLIKIKCNKIQEIN